MYARLVQGYETMEPDSQLASAYAARQLRLMVNRSSLSGSYEYVEKLWF